MRLGDGAVLFHDLFALGVGLGCSQIKLLNCTKELNNGTSMKYPVPFKFWSVVLFTWVLVITC